VNAEARGNSGPDPRATGDGAGIGDSMGLENTAGDPA